MFWNLMAIWKKSLCFFLLIDLCFYFIVFISCSELGMWGHPFEERWGFVHCLLFMALFAVICIAILSPKLQANTFVLHCILNTTILRSFWCDENYFSEWAWNHQLFDWSHVSIQTHFPISALCNRHCLSYSCWNIRQCWVTCGGKMQFPFWLILTHFDCE